MNILQSMMTILNNIKSKFDEGDKYDKRNYFISIAYFMCDMLGGMFNFCR